MCVCMCVNAHVCMNRRWVYYMNVVQDVSSCMLLVCVVFHDGGKCCMLCVLCCSVSVVAVFSLCWCPACDVFNMFATCNMLI